MAFHRHVMARCATCGRKCYDEYPTTRGGGMNLQAVHRTGHDALPAFDAPYAPADEDLAAALLADAAGDGEGEGRIDRRAGRLIAAIRARAGGLGGVDDLLHAYAL